MVMRCTHPFGTVIDIAVRIPNLAEHPKLESSGRVDGLLETPDHRPTMRETSGHKKRTIQARRLTS